MTDRIIPPMYQGLLVYSASQTYTQTVFEHVDAFRKYSQINWRFVDINFFNSTALDLNPFQVVVVHYSVRLPYKQISQSRLRSLSRFHGIKLLFIQDEYDLTNIVKQAMRTVRFDLVYTTVPDRSIEKIYPKAEFPETKFINNFTGYAPGDKNSLLDVAPPPSERPLTIAYRGRKLPEYYGRFSQEKYDIAVRVRSYCEANGISNDIEFAEDKRIYGDAWYSFVSSAKAMLGTESGANVFDWDGSLRKSIARAKRRNSPHDTSTLLRLYTDQYEQPGLMNQLSPRIFEMARARTAMVLLEGEYSGVIQPDKHFLSLKKDFSNLPDVFVALNNGALVDEMTNRTYADIIASELWNYRTFIQKVDKSILDFSYTRIQNIESRYLQQYGAPSPFPTASSIPVSMLMGSSEDESPKSFIHSAYRQYSKIPYKYRGFLTRQMRSYVLPVMIRLFSYNPRISALLRRFR